MARHRTDEWGSMNIDNRPRRQWDDHSRLEASRICHALSFAAQRLARLHNPPAIAVNYRRRREIPWPLHDLPGGYVVVHRTESADDVGVFRCYGPGGFERDFVTQSMAQACCEAQELERRQGEP
jgi:hypothetical protein